MPHVSITKCSFNLLHQASVDSLLNMSLDEISAGGKTTLSGETHRSSPYTRGDSGSKSGGNARLYVGNLSWDTAWQDLKDYFKQAGEVSHVWDPLSTRAVQPAHVLTNHNYCEQIIACLIFLSTLAKPCDFSFANNSMSHFSVHPCQTLRLFGWWWLRATWWNDDSKNKQKTNETQCW